MQQWFSLERKKFTKLFPIEEVKSRGKNLEISQKGKLEKYCFLFKDRYCRKLSYFDWRTQANNKKSHPIAWKRDWYLKTLFPILSFAVTFIIDVLPKTAYNYQVFSQNIVCFLKVCWIKKNTKYNLMINNLKMTQFVKRLKIIFHSRLSCYWIVIVLTLHYVFFLLR